MTHLGLYLVNTALHADDPALYCASYRPGTISNGLQIAASAISKYYKRLRLKVNTDIFTRKHGSPPAKINIMVTHFL